MRLKIDFVYLQTVILLIGFGILSIYSHTFYSQIFFGSNFYISKGLKNVAIGLVVLFLAILFPLDFYRRSLLPASLYNSRFFRPFFKIFPKPFTLISVLWLLFLGLILLNVAKVLSGSSEVERSVGFFQPQEFFKYAHLLLLAQMEEQGKRPLVCILLSLFAVAAVFLQRAMGTAGILFLSSLFLFVLMRIKAIYVLLYIAFALSFLIMGGGRIPYIQRRAKEFIQEKKEELGFLRQEIRKKKMTHQDYSKLAIGSGMLWGRGLGQGRQKFGFLARVCTDFIFSGICEEMGFVGASIILILFFVLIWRGFLIAAAFSPGFEYITAAGVSVIIGLYFFVHIFVALDVLPCTGQPLPFISYGGSALTSNLWAAGTVLNISHARMKNG